MENASSVVVEDQQQNAIQKNKKKSKNKKQHGKANNVMNGNSKTSLNSSEVAACSTKESELTELLKKSLHIGETEEKNHLEMNGIVSTDIAHATHNGHCTAVSKGDEKYKTSNGTGNTTPPDQSKKPRSKSNKLKNKETTNNHINDVTSQQVNPDTAQKFDHLVQSNSSVKGKILENGFNHVSDETSDEPKQNANVNIEKQEKGGERVNVKTSSEPLNPLTAKELKSSDKQNELVANSSVEIRNTKEEIKSKAVTTPLTHTTNFEDTAKSSATSADTTPATSIAANAASVSASASANAAVVSATTEIETPAVETPALDLSNVQIEYKEYESELQMHDIMRLIQAELSEPYSIYTYRYFIYNWPKLCFLAAHGNEYVGAIVCKLDMHMNARRGYIAMLAVRKEYRKLKIGTTLVQKAIEAMLADNADEVVLETEMRNVPALRLYENLGFVRDKRLFRYYLNGVDALRLKLWFR